MAKIPEIIWIALLILASAAILAIAFRNKLRVLGICSKCGEVTNAGRCSNCERARP